MEDHHHRITKFKTHLAQTNEHPFLIEVDKAKGSWIYDTSGKKYLDMIAGVAVNNIGHSHPKVIEAIKQQVDKHLHVMVYGEFIQESQLLAAESLVATLPNSLNVPYFVNSGTEANEAAIKLAKRITGRFKIISFKGAYHGNTNGSMSISYNEIKKAPFRPLLPGIEFIELNNFEDLKRIDNQTAGVILETIQGDAGVRAPSQEYMMQLRQRCTEMGAQLIFDEIQCGMGRTGYMHAFERFNVIPDILTLGKALGGGMPVGAFVSSAKKMKLLTNNPMLGHITTFGGHPVICSAIAANLSVFKEENILDQVEKKGQKIESLLQHRKIKEIRRVGLMFAIDLENAEQVQKVVDFCLDQGLLSFWFLSCPSSFRLSPPLTITDDEIVHGCEIIKAALDQL